MTTLEQLSSASAANAAAANSASENSNQLAEDFDTFLQLLTTQLQNQNPLEPLDTNQFTQQLVQFAGVEQQIQSNSYLETLISSTEAQSVNAAVSYLGSTVRAEGTTTNLANGQASWDLISTIAAPDSSVSIFDANGREVFSSPYSVEAGKSTFNWNGRTNTGGQAPQGEYSIRIVGNSSDGSPVPIATAVNGVVTGVDFTGAEPMLQLGGIQVNLASVLSITAPEPQQTASQNTTDSSDGTADGEPDPADPLPN